MKRLPEIVRFEARQQIPFPLDDVIWDYQMMGVLVKSKGFLMEAEVGLFAMKRDQVYEALQPFLTADLEIHHIQLAPLCAYNFLAHSLLAEALENDVYDADSPPDSYVILNVGTDTTDLVITNGFRVWQRSVPLGGNHFTKQLTKELKLTFAKAEHLKRNVREAEDAKAVIQSMRPVFNDFLTEVQRSVGFFQNIDRRAQIGGIIALGNAVKLPGLQQYLSKNLGYPLVDVEQQAWGARMAGQAVLTSPQFKENLPSFAICYGLCLQGLGLAKLNTNLLPKEIITERLIRSKKPWAVATAGALMLAFAVSFFFEYNEWYKVHPTTKFAEALPGTRPCRRSPVSKRSVPVSIPRPPAGRAFGGVGSAGRGVVGQLGSAPAVAGIDESHQPFVAGGPEVRAEPDPRPSSHPDLAAQGLAYRIRRIPVLRGLDALVLAHGEAEVRRGASASGGQDRRHGRSGGSASCRGRGGGTGGTGR
jgi:type IV pilus assembly protein PilM